jgi:hypothetical protein
MNLSSSTSFSLFTSSGKKFEEFIENDFIEKLHLNNVFTLKSVIS